MTPVRPVFQGGKTVYGAPLGILMLQTRFPRIPGDMGHAGSWPFPVLFKVVHGATPDRVVLRDPTTLLPAFVEAARELVDMGAEAITTTCGFLSLFQRELSEAVAVPVATSALLQVPWVQATLPPGRRVGVITVSAKSLTADHLRAAGAANDTPVSGVEHGKELFHVLVTGSKPDLDTRLAEEDVLKAGEALVAAHPNVGAIVLECTNMPPYAAALREALGLPVYDVYSMVAWFQMGLRPQRW